jgi:hypothetical protein
MGRDIMRNLRKSLVIISVLSFLCSIVSLTIILSPAYAQEEINKVTSNEFISRGDENSEMAAQTTGILSGQQITTRLKFPVKGYENPYSVPITAVLDHSRAATRIIVSYTGERGRSVDGTPHYYRNLIGYINNSNSPFYLTGSYTGGGDPNALWYEMLKYQHSGYDFGVTGTIIAPAGGDLYLVGDDPINGRKKTSSGWCGFHTFKIVHDTDEIETWYLHAENLVDSLKNKVDIKYYNCTTSIPDGGLLVARVEANDPIAIIGGWGDGCWTKKDKDGKDVKHCYNDYYGKHLHFEVRKKMGV